ncbi:MAG: exo-alpha-sialidase, partial [Bacteroidales bacterium]|nr:exo-alpha-sialidase [Bacteroidales bacterium]
VDAYASVDGGKTWIFQSTAGNGGKGNGNPPALAITLDGRLCTVFGEREFGTIQVAYSSDEGKSWSEPQILIDEFWSEDMELADMGYPRVLARSDGKMVAIYYYSTKEYLHHIHATIWNPN